MQRVKDHRVWGAPCGSNPWSGDSRRLRATRRRGVTSSGLADHRRTASRSSPTRVTVSGGVSAPAWVVRTRRRVRPALSMNQARTCRAASRLNWPPEAANCVRTAGPVRTSRASRMISRRSVASLVFGRFGNAWSFVAMSGPLGHLDRVFESRSACRGADAEGSRRPERPVMSAQSSGVKPVGWILGQFGEFPSLISRTSIRTSPDAVVFIAPAPSIAVAPLASRTYNWPRSPSARRFTVSTSVVTRWAAVRGGRARLGRRRALLAGSVCARPRGSLAGARGRPGRTSQLG